MTLLLCSYLTAGQKGAVPAGHQQFATPSIVACCWWFGCLLSWVEIYRVINTVSWVVTQVAKFGMMPFLRRAPCEALLLCFARCRFGSCLTALVPLTCVRCTLRLPRSFPAHSKCSLHGPICNIYHGCDRHVCANVAKCRAPVRLHSAADLPCGVSAISKAAEKA